MFLCNACLLPDGYLCAWSGNQGSTHTLDYVFTRVNNELWGSSELQALQKKALILPKLLSDSSQSVASEHEPCAREISRACLWSPYHSPQAEQGGTGRGRGGAKCWALAGYSCDGNRHFQGKGQGQRQDVQLLIQLCLLGRRGGWRAFFCFSLHRAGEHILGWATPWASPEMEQGCTSGRTVFVC